MALLLAENEPRFSVNESTFEDDLNDPNEQTSILNQTLKYSVSAQIFDLTVDNSILIGKKITAANYKDYETICTNEEKEK